ncbi:T7SS effector LXG polymorphic toxin [Staphylococcus sp. HKU1]|uniref:T7SS effector LXG polymorphic toxin n=1 Tax=Staphylococcus hsinchuensis TaxID=3051183 RepID=A0ABZ3EGP1_9STAP|nr:T7SS effector LXG polymorphic toxin [Staphylococcus sp. Marseille-Q6910]
MSKSIKKFEGEVDNSHSAILVEDQINKYQRELKNILKGVNESGDHANNAISNVSHLTTAKKIKLDRFDNEKQDLDKHIDKTIEKLTDFDANNSIDGDRTDNLITELDGLSSYVKNLSPNRSRISSTSKKIENAKARHKTSETLIRWQKFMETTSEKIYDMPGLSHKSYQAMKQAGQEYFAVKQVGDGSAYRGFKKYIKVRDINQIINNMDQKRLSKMATVLNTDRGNIKVKNVLKHAGEFTKNNPFKKGNLVTWMSKVQNYDSQSAEVLRRSLKEKNFQFTFSESKKFFDTAEMKKAASTEFKNTFTGENFRNAFLKKENFKSKTAAKNNIKKYWNDDVKGRTKGFAKEFKSNNVLGKLGKLTKLGGKVLKPLAVVSAITDNLDKKSGQEKAIGMGVDLAAIGGSAAAGAAIGTAIPVPVVGTLTGAVFGAVVGTLMDMKIPGLNKSATQLAKDGINAGVNKIKEGGASAWKSVTSGFKTAFT